MPNLIEAARELLASSQALMSDDPMRFAKSLWIPSATGKQNFGECMASFQRSCLESIAPSLVAVRDGTMPPRRRFWIERTKGASKDADLAICLLWLLRYATRPLFIQAGAADRDQAAIIKRRMGDLLHYNHELQDYISIKQNRVEGPNGLGVMEILAADVAGSHGETPDVLVVNELSHVTRWEFVENLLDNADKVSQGLVLIATNAGFRGTPVEVWRKNAEAHPDVWTMHIWARPAPWISPQSIADAKQRNATSRFQRLWYGRWCSGKGDALQEESIDRCLSALPGPTEEPEEGWVCLAGLDLGISHDHAALVVAGVNPELRKIRVYNMQAWVPAGKRGEVDLIAVQDAILAMWERYRLVAVWFDPTEARLMGQQLRRRSVAMAEMNFASSKNRTAMAESLMQVMNGNILEAYEDDEGRLRRDFAKFDIKEQLPVGYKLVAVSDEYGHADVGTALVILLPAAVQMLQSVGLRPDDVLFGGDDDDGMTEEQIVESMPAGLREIYGDPEPGKAAVRMQRPRKPARSKPKAEDGGTDTGLQEIIDAMERDDDRYDREAA